MQRVTRAAVHVGDETIGEIGRGLCLLCCSVTEETDADVDWLADKIVDLRVFDDADGRTNLSIEDVGGSVLVVPQFTLAAAWRKGRRPSFTASAPPDVAVPRLERLIARVESRGVSAARGRFGAEMRVELVNQGPFTLVLDSAERPRSS